MSNYLMIHDEDACVACGICAAFCPTDVFTLFELDGSQGDDKSVWRTAVATVESHAEKVRESAPLTGDDTSGPTGTMQALGAEGTAAEYRVAAAKAALKEIGGVAQASGEQARAFTKPGERLQITAPGACVGCETCVAQCPREALKMEYAPGATGDDVDALGRVVEANPLADLPKADPLPKERKQELKEWSDTLRDILGLRWRPVGITLLPTGAPVPDVPVPKESLRYCQQLMIARRGVPVMLPINRHSCPDGTSILGLSEVPPKLANGEIYLLFHKLDTLEAAQRMVGERPTLEPRSVAATVTAPLDMGVCEPEVIFVTCTPEQTMWLCMSAAYYTGHRFDFHASGYNSLCVETTLIPREHKEMNISFGCYGCRAASDVEDEMMFVGIPVEMMPQVVKGLRELSVKTIPQSRARCYLPPRI